MLFRSGELEGRYSSGRRHLCYWPTRIGGPHLEGRRLFAAAPFLVNEEVTFFCNDDDWYKPDHVESLMGLIERGRDWAYSLRSIYEKDGTFLFDDQCEALGELHECWNVANHHFVDLNMWAMRTECLQTFAPILARKGWGMDRVLYQAFRESLPNFATTARHTFCFRLGGNEYSVTRAFFEQGHESMRRRYPGGMPWTRR